MEGYFFSLYLKFLLGWRCVLDPTKQNSQHMYVCAKMRDKRPPVAWRRWVLVGE